MSALHELSSKQAVGHDDTTIVLTQFKHVKHVNLPIIGVWGNLTYTPIRDEVVMVVTGRGLQGGITGFGIKIEPKAPQTAAKERGLIGQEWLS